MHSEQKKVHGAGRAAIAWCAATTVVDVSLEGQQINSVRSRTLVPCCGAAIDAVVVTTSGCVTDASCGVSDAGVLPAALRCAPRLVRAAEAVA